MKWNILGIADPIESLLPYKSHSRNSTCIINVPSSVSFSPLEFFPVSLRLCQENNNAVAFTPEGILK